MVASKCPILDSTLDCSIQNCFFYRAGGCAVVLGATISEENSRKIDELSRKLDAVDYNLRLLINAVNQLINA